MTRNLKTPENNAGFTLIELLIVVALVIITVGISGDIILTLVRSYNKTQVSNEIEQNANFIMLKMEKELKNATSLTSIEAKKIVFVKDINNTPATIEYEIKVVNGVGAITRAVTNLSQDYLMTDNSADGGVEVDVGASNFSYLLADPAVIGVHLEFTESSTSTSPVFTGNVVLDNTIVVRGTY